MHFLIGSAIFNSVLAHLCRHSLCSRHCQRVSAHKSLSTQCRCALARVPCLTQQTPPLPTHPSHACQILTDKPCFAQLGAGAAAVPWVAHVVRVNTRCAAESFRAWGIGFSIQARGSRVQGVEIRPRKFLGWPMYVVSLEHQLILLTRGSGYSVAEATRAGRWRGRASGHAHAQMAQSSPSYRPGFVWQGLARVRGRPAMCGSDVWFCGQWPLLSLRRTSRQRRPPLRRSFARRRRPLPPTPRASPGCRVQPLRTARPMTAHASRPHHIHCPPPQTITRAPPRPPHPHRPPRSPPPRQGVPARCASRLQRPHNGGAGSTACRSAEAADHGHPTQPRSSPLAGCVPPPLR